jgi:hypothetical protein
VTALDENQISYLRDVLGIQNVMLPFAEAAASGPFEQAKLVVVSNGETPESFQLAERMIQAMKLHPHEVTWLTWDLKTSHATEDLLMQVGQRPVLVFRSPAFIDWDPIQGPLGEWFDWEGVRLMATYSPTQLLHSPEKKKEAWSHLQTIMKTF